MVLKASFRLSWQMFEDETRDDPEVLLLRQTVMIATTKVRKALARITSRNCMEPLNSKGCGWSMKNSAKLQALRRVPISNRTSQWCVSFCVSYDQPEEVIRTCTSLVFVACFPWMFAYDRTNYSRYRPVYWCDMISLIDVHPSTHKSFQAGNFVVQRSGNAFSQVAVDQTIE